MWQELTAIGLVFCTGILGGSAYARYAVKHKISIVDGVIDYITWTLIGMVVGLGVVALWLN